MIKTLGIESSLITEEQLDYSIKKVKECCEIISFKKYGTSNSNEIEDWNVSFAKTKHTNWYKSFLKEMKNI